MILSAALCHLLAFAASAVHAQSIMRTPNLNVGSRVPTINPTVAPRINPTIAARPSRTRRYRRANAAVTDHASTHASPHARRAVDAALCARFRPTSIRLASTPIAVRDGECFDRPVMSAGGGGGNGSARPRRAMAAPRNNDAQAAVNLRTVQNELVAEIDGALSTAEADELARRHGLERIASQNFPLLGGTIGLFRIIDRRPVDTVRREFAADGSVRSVQLNFRYFLQDQKKPR